MSEMVRQIGFSITCLRCGATMVMKPGVRDLGAESIGFGTDGIFCEDWIGCRCGNAIQSDVHYPEKGKSVVIWVDASKRPTDESTAYGNDCPGGKCEW